MAQARHYTTLQELYRKTKQNRDDVAQLLDLEFEGRRALIDSDTIREQDRPAKILEAYPCLRDIDHVSMIAIHTSVQFNSERVLLNIRSILL